VLCVHPRVQEFLDGGSVLDLVKKKLLREKHIAIIVREVLLGLAYLSQEGKIHRDIKGRIALFPCKLLLTGLACLVNPTALACLVVSVQPPTF
jgi:serine/threonine protein kinase